MKARLPLSELLAGLAVVSICGAAAGLFWWALETPPIGLRIATCSCVVLAFSVVLLMLNERGKGP